MISVQNAAGLVASLSNSEVFVMNADGSSMRNLSNNPAFDGWPRCSPDGKRIVFGSNRENKTDYEIYLMNADGGFRAASNESLRSQHLS